MSNETAASAKTAHKASASDDSSYPKRPSQQPLMPQEQPNNPLHGITLQTIVTELVDHYGWEQLGRHININSFHNNPSVKSSLKFLRKTDWARKKVENLYLDTFH